MSSEQWVVTLTLTLTLTHHPNPNPNPTPNPNPIPNPNPSPIPSQVPLMHRLLPDTPPSPGAANQVVRLRPLCEEALRSLFNPSPNPNLTLTSSPNPNPNPNPSQALRSFRGLCEDRNQRALLVLQAANPKPNPSPSPSSSPRPSPRPSPDLSPRSSSSLSPNPNPHQAGLVTGWSASLAVVPLYAAHMFDASPSELGTLYAKP